MIREGLTVKEATERWVNEFSRFPHDMIEKLMSFDMDSWREVTVPATGDNISIWNLPDEDAEGNMLDTIDDSGEIIEYVEGKDLYLVRLNDGSKVLLAEDDFEVKQYELLPMWGWMWQFDDSADYYWLEELDGVRAMSECGFRVYKHEEWGYFFGIDGCGYDFYEVHWIPLYKNRGLQWHDPATEK